MSTNTAALFTPFDSRGLRLKNRIVIAPMQTYMGRNGAPTDWHNSHLQKFALGGAGLVFTEALAVEPRGRNTHGDLGVWSDDLVPGLARIADTLKASGTAAGAQLFHCGPKAARQRPWEGYGPLGPEQEARGEAPWQPVAPSPVAKVEGWAVPKALSLAEIADIIEAYRQGARRCREAGFDALNIHAAHGYLIHSFYSPLSNLRTDAYGGSREGRMRLALDIAEAVRGEWPQDRPLFFRLSCVDGGEGGWSIEDTVALSAELGRRGVDIIDCSSGGIGVSPTAATWKRRPGFQVPYAAQVRRETGLPTMAVGLILKARQAEAIVADGRADLVAIAREALFNPHWPLHAAVELGVDPDWSLWPPNYGWWLQRRARTLDEKS